MINLARLKERVEKATAGPWRGDYEGTKWDVFAPNGDAVFIVADCEGYKIDSQEAWHNMDFIAHARTDIPKLIEAIEILSAACEKIENPRKRDHVEPDYQTRYYCLMNIANEALELAAKKLGEINA